MVFENFWYIIGSIFGLTIPFLVSLYDLIKVNFYIHISSLENTVFDYRKSALPVAPFEDLT